MKKTVKQPKPAVRDAEKTNYVGTTVQIQDAARALLRELGGSENVGNVVIWNTGDHSDPIIQSKYAVPPPPPPPPAPTINGLVRALAGKLVDAADAPFHSLGISYDTATDKFTLRWLSASEMNLPNATEENYENLKNLNAKAFMNSMYGKMGGKD